MSSGSGVSMSSPCNTPRPPSPVQKQRRCGWSSQACQKTHLHLQEHTVDKPPFPPCSAARVDQGAASSLLYDGTQTPLCI